MEALAECARGANRLIILRRREEKESGRGHWDEGRGPARLHKRDNRANRSEKAGQGMAGWSGRLDERDGGSTDQLL